MFLNWPSNFRFSSKSLFKKHQISAGQLSAESSWTETFYRLKQIHIIFTLSFFSYICKILPKNIYGYKKARKYSFNTSFRSVYDIVLKNIKLSLNVILKCFPQFKVAWNSFQYFPRFKFWRVIKTTLYRLMPKSWYEKYCPIIGELVAVNLVA